MPSQRGPLTIQRWRRAFHSFPATEDQASALSLLAGAQLVPLLSQAILSPSHGCPLDSTGQPSSSRSAHLGFPTRSFGSSLARSGEAARVVATCSMKAVRHLAEAE